MIQGFQLSERTAYTSDRPQRYISLYLPRNLQSSKMLPAEKLQRLASVLACLGKKFKR